MKCIIEIGMNRGEDSQSISAAYGPVDKYFGFEPNTTQLAAIEMSTVNMLNFEFIGKGVWSENGVKKFNINEYKGISSFHDVNPDIPADYHYYRYDAPIISKAYVPTIRMDTFIEEKGIEEVVYMHCDAQGSDIDVLKSFGSHIDKLKRGCVEVSDLGFVHVSRE